MVVARGFRHLVLAVRRLRRRAAQAQTRRKDGESQRNNRRDEAHQGLFPLFRCNPLKIGAAGVLSMGTL